MAGHCGAKRILNQKIQNTPWSEHFWKLGCGKMAGHCGEKHIFKSRNTKHTMLRALLEVGVWKNGRSRAKRIFKSRNTKHTMVGALLEVGVWKNGRSLWCEAYFFQIDSEHFWKLGRGKMVGHCGAKRIFKSRKTKHTMLGTLLEVRAWKNGRSLRREAYFQIKKYKAHHAWSTFGSWGVEKWQITVERSIFSNQKIPNTPCSEHFWKLGCGKMAGHCGAKRILKPRNTKHTMLGALWREAYFQIKKYQTHHARSTFGSWGVEKWQVTVARSVF